MLTPEQIETLRDSVYPVPQNVSGLCVFLKGSAFWIKDAAGTFLCQTSDLEIVGELISLESAGGWGTVQALLKKPVSLEEIGL